MRRCAKLRCGSDPVATVALLYADRRVVMTELTPERDPHLLDLCREHSDRITPPLGWTITDRRSVAAAG